MSELEVMEIEFSKEHDYAENILKEIGKKNSQKITEIKVRCKSEARAKAIEYLNGKITAEYSSGECDMTLSVIESKHLWFGTLLALGSGIIVKEPEHIQKRLLNAAKEIVSLYKQL